MLGAGVSAAFIAVGVTDAGREQDEQVDRRASELIDGMETSWLSCETAGFFVYEAC